MGNILSILFNSIHSVICGEHKRNNGFALNLLEIAIRNKQKELKNVLISPFSLHTCLSLLLLGAEKNTEQELKDALQCKTTDPIEVSSKYRSKILSKRNYNRKIFIGNRIYVDKNIVIKPEFNNIATKYFNSQAVNVDFAKKYESSKEMSDWVKERTDYKINHAIRPSILNNVNALLLSTFYFSSEWKIQFEIEETRQDQFWVDDERFDMVKMMYVQDDFKYGEFDELGATVIELPYRRTDISMWVIVPYLKTSLNEVFNKINPKTLANINENIHYENVELNFPKFKLEYSIVCNEILEEMGMKSMFTVSANFGRLSATEFRIEYIHHKAVLEVNEFGTEISGEFYSTSLLQFKRFTEDPSKCLDVDRPFVFFIKDHNTIYFVGFITNL